MSGRLLQEKLSKQVFNSVSVLIDWSSFGSKWSSIFHQFMVVVGTHFASFLLVVSGKTNHLTAKP